MKELSRWFDGVVQSVQRGMHQTCWQPAVDVYETNGGWILKCDLAGVPQEDIKVSVSNRTVTISGCRRDHLAESGLVHRSLEISYSSFKRTLTLPGPIDAQRVEANIENGLLLVNLTREGGGTDDK